MMYHKAMLSHDDKIAEELMLTTSPKKQKALGRKVKGFDNVMWETNRERIVEEGNWNKFANAKDEVGLKQLLLDTGERELVEVSNRVRCLLFLWYLADVEMRLLHTISRCVMMKLFQPASDMS